MYNLLNVTDLVNYEGEYEHVIANSTELKLNNNQKMKMIFLYALLVGESIYFCGLWPLMNHLPQEWIIFVFKIKQHQV